MTSKFKGRVALITGGTSGIGFALAQALTAAGAEVVICGRDRVRLAAAELKLPQVVGLRCDITQTVSVIDMMAEIETRFGGLDLLVNNAGRLVERDFRDAPLNEADLAEEIDANLTAHIRVTNRALCLLRHSDRPHLVFIGSGYGLTPVGRAPLYSASKAGLRAFSKALRLRPPLPGLTVTEVIPPVVDTPATAHRQVAKMSPEQVARTIVRGLGSNKPEIYLGQARALPLLLRLAPGLVERRVART